MRTRSTGDVDSEVAEVEAVETDDEVTITALQVPGPDIFLAVRSPRRDRLPASLRRGRHMTKDARRAAARANHPCNGPSPMYLVDGEGEFEEARIAIRQRFEAIAIADAAAKAQESAAG